MAGYVVTGALVIAKGEDEKVRYYYQGAELPDDLPKDEVKRLVATGLVEPVKKPATTRSSSSSASGSGSGDGADGDGSGTSTDRKPAAKSESS